MPKLKSKGAVKKRFRITKSGKAICSRPARGHYKAPETPKAKRNLRRSIVLEGTWARLMRKMMNS